METKVPDFATVTELEGILQLSRTQIYKHLRRAQLEPAQPGKRYRVREVLEAIVRHREDDNRLKSSPELKQRKLELETEILETRLRQTEGELIDKADERAQDFQIARTVRDAILAVPERVSAILAAERDPAKVELTLRLELRKALSHLARVLESDEELEDEREP